MKKFKLEEVKEMFTKEGYIKEISIKEISKEEISKLMDNLEKWNPSYKRRIYNYFLGGYIFKNITFKCNSIQAKTVYRYNILEV